MPTLINSYLVSTTSGAGTLTSPAFTPATGEIIVVKAVSEDTTNKPLGSASASGGGITFTQWASVTTGSYCAAKIHTGTVTSGGSSITVSHTATGPAAVWSMVVERWDGADSALDATPVVVQTTVASGQTTTITTEAAGSAISWALGDWSATAPGTPTYSSSGGTPTQEGVHNASPNNYVGYYVRQTTTAGAGSKTFGVTSPTGLKSAIVAIEILAAGGGGGTTATPTGIASAEAFGTPVRSSTLTSSPGGIGSGETFGAVVAALSLTATGVGIASGEAFGTPVETGALTVTCQAIPSGEAFGTATHTGALTATPGGIGTGETLGTPSANLGYTAAPEGVASGESFGSPTNITTLTADPGGIASGEALGSPSASSGTAAQPPGIVSAEAFGSPVAVVPRTASPSGIASGETFGTPAASGSLTVSPAAITSGQAFGTPAASLAWVAAPAGIGSGETFGSPSNIQPLLVSPAGIASGEAFGAATTHGGTLRDLVLRGDPLRARFATVPLVDRFASDPLEVRFMSVSLAGRWSVARLEGEAMRKEVLVSAGAAEYVGGTVTELTGKDISGATFMMSLGGPTNPGAWVAPTVSTAGDGNDSRVLKLLVNSSSPKGTFYAWARISDSPEVAPVRFPQEIIIR